MKILYKNFNPVNLIYENYYYICFDKLYGIRIDENVHRIQFDTNNGQFSFLFECEYVVSETIEYILSAYLKGIKFLDISDFVEKAFVRKSLIDKSKKEKMKELEKRKLMTKNGLSFPEYEFREGALSMHHKDNDEGKLSMHHKDNDEGKLSMHHKDNDEGKLSIED